MALDGTLRQMRDAGVIGSAVVSRDGTVQAADLPPAVSRETFSIMCATIHGAGITVSNELRRGTPKRIVIESPEGHVVITEAGRRSLLVLVLPPDANLDEVATKLRPFTDAIARESG